MIQNVLFARDFSSSSDRALAYGIDLAERTGATLHMMHVQVHKPDPLAAPKISAMPIDKLQAKFKERNRTSLQSYGIDADDERLFHHVEREEAAGPALVRFAEREDVDLIVMGTHGRRGVRRVIYGSVAEDVLRTAPCPVLITRAEDGQTEAAPIERIVVPMDFSELSQGALRYARGLARIYGVPLRLIHVVENPAWPAIYGLKSDQVASREVKARAERTLNDRVERLSEEGLDASFVVHRGEPGDTIIDTASNMSDFIVMATRGLSGLQRTMIGSVTEEVIRQAEGPVLAARQFPESP